MKTPDMIISPSQFTNIGWFILTIGGLAAHPFIGASFAILLIWSVLDVMTWNYQFYGNLMVERRGIFSVTEESVNYFRIKSIRLHRPFWMRIFGLSIITIATSEAYKPEIRLYGVEHGREILDIISDLAKLKRKQNGVRDTDLFYS
jgi:uncharacterized membrane protein YdbT with pleckstrin-like domain